MCRITTYTHEFVLTILMYSIDKILSSLLQAVPNV